LKKLLLAIVLIGLVTGLTLATGLGLTLYFKEHPLINQLLERSAVLLAVGVVAGFSARIILHKWHVFWRVLFSVLSAGAGLLILDGFFGVNYPEIFVTENWRYPIWIDLLTAGISGWMAIFAGIIGYKRRTLKKTARHETKVAPTSKQTPASAQKAYPTSNAIKVKGKKPTQKKGLRKITRKKLISRKSSLKIKPSEKVKTKGAAVSTRWMRRKEVKLLGGAENRCPYCLELIKKDDPRGVVICPECKTWHHKDCWDVTGSCQVAHRHDL